MADRARSVEIELSSGWRAEVSLTGKYLGATYYEPEEWPDAEVTALWYPDGVAADVAMLEHLPKLRESLESKAIEADEERRWDSFED